MAVSYIHRLQYLVNTQYLLVLVPAHLIWFPSILLTGLLPSLTFSLLFSNDHLNSLLDRCLPYEQDVTRFPSCWGT